MFTTRMRLIWRAEDSQTSLGFTKFASSCPFPAFICLRGNRVYINKTWRDLGWGLSEWIMIEATSVLINYNISTWNYNWKSTQVGGKKNSVSIHNKVKLGAEALHGHWKGCCLPLLSYLSGILHLQQMVTWLLNLRCFFSLTFSDTEACTKAR